MVLCTTDSESPEFYAGLDQLAAKHNFRIFRTEVAAAGGGGQRSAAAPVRDKLIRDALFTVRAPYVVCIDADTVTTEPLERLVGVVEASGVDIASVRLVAANHEGLLARFQGHEYRMAMRMRRLYPWLISGACHVARTEVHREVMSRHSLFFQGNDAELGILADAMGYDVGHVLFDVPTTVPSSVRTWWRQRLAWAGGEFRIYAVNCRLGWRHPWFWFYGLVIVIAFAPLRWISMFQSPRNVGIILLMYVATLFALNWRTKDRALPLLPIYMMIGTLILVPLSVYSYLRMATKHRNFGIIDPSRWVATVPVEVDAEPGTRRGAPGVGDPLVLSRCMTVAAMGGRYSVPWHLGHDRLWVSAHRSEVRIARRSPRGLVVVATHEKVRAGHWSILGAHVPRWHPDGAEPSLEDLLDDTGWPLLPEPLPRRGVPAPELEPATAG